MEMPGLPGVLRVQSANGIICNLMRLVPFPLISFEQSTVIASFIPDAPYRYEDVSAEKFSPVVIEGVGEARMLSRVLRMAATFNQERAERTKLGHDCVVFALACVTDDPLYGRAFKGLGGEEVLFPETRTAPLTRADLKAYGRSAGAVVCTYAISKTDSMPPEYAENSFHAQVRATHADDPPLFVSKFGGTGIVAFHTVEEGIRAYPATTIYEAGEPIVKPRT